MPPWVPWSNQAHSIAAPVHGGSHGSPTPQTPSPCRTVRLTPLPFPFPLPRLDPCRSILEQYPAFRPSILGKLLANFSTIQSSAVLGVASWYALPPSPHPSPCSLI